MEQLQRSSKTKKKQKKMELRAQRARSLPVHEVVIQGNKLPAWVPQTPCYTWEENN